MYTPYCILSLKRSLNSLEYFCVKYELHSMKVSTTILTTICRSLCSVSSLFLPPFPFCRYPPFSLLSILPPPTSFLSLFSLSPLRPLLRLSSTFCFFQIISLEFSVLSYFGLVDDPKPYIHILFKTLLINIFSLTALYACQVFHIYIPLISL